MTTLNINILNQVFEVAKDYNAKEILIDLLNYKENEDVIINYLNSHLQIASTRSNAFNYIDELLPYLSYNNLKSNGNQWLGKCLDLKIPYKKMHFNIILNLIRNLDQEQEFHKYVVTSCISKLIEQCLVVNSYTENLICLELLLLKYPNACLPHKTKIEEFLLNVLVENSNMLILKQCGRCLHFLQQVGGGGINGITHKNNWSFTFKKLCSTIHSFYDTFFENLPEYNDYERINAEPYKFPEVPSSTSSIQLLNVVASRINNLIIYLQLFLESKYPVTKNLTPQQVLDVIKRGLSVHNCSMGKMQSLNDIALRDNIIKVQVNLFGLLRSFLACLNNNAIPYSTAITKLLTDTLLQTRKCNCFEPYNHYFNCLYKVFIYWIVLAKNRVDVSCHNKLITFVIEQIKPEKTSLQLTIKAGNKKQQNKKNNSYEETCIEPLKRVYPSLSVAEVTCLNSLNLLECLFNYVVLCVPQEKFVDMFNVVIKALLNLQNGIKEYPYTNEKCEERLYDVLLSFFEQPFTVYSPPFDVMASIFLNGQKSRNSKIVLICYRGTNLIEKFAQPIYPTLYLDATSNSLSNGCELSESTLDVNEGEAFTIARNDVEEKTVSNVVITERKENSNMKRASTETSLLENYKRKKAKEDINVAQTESHMPPEELTNFNTGIEKDNKTSDVTSLIVETSSIVENNSIKSTEMSSSTEELTVAKKALETTQDEYSDDDMLSSFNNVLADT